MYTKTSKMVIKDSHLRSVFECQNLTKQTTHHPFKETPQKPPPLLPTKSTTPKILNLNQKIKKIKKEKKKHHYKKVVPR